MTETSKEALAAFVKALCSRPSDDIEKVFVHILDTSRNRWNRKAAELLRQLKDKDMDPEVLQDLKAQYAHAFSESIRISKMRYGVALPRRSLGAKENKK